MDLAQCQLHFLVMLGKQAGNIYKRFCKMRLVKKTAFVGYFC